MVPDGVSPSKTSLQLGTAPGAGAAGREPAWRYRGAAYSWPWFQPPHACRLGPAWACDSRAASVVAGDTPVEVSKVMITDAGREVLGESGERFR
jgi:hypothetical protein